MRDARKARAAFVAAAVSLASTLSSSALARTDGTWIADVGTAGGNWSNPANWFGGVVPDAGGTATFVPPSTFGTAPLAVIQDGATVSLSKLVFDSFITYNLTRPTASPNNSITLVGAGEFSLVRPSINSISNTTFGHQLTLPIAGSVGLTKTGPGTLTVWQTNTYTGATNVNGGILVARQFGDSLFGNAANQININDGTIRITTGAWSSARTINLGGVGGGTIEASTGSTGAATFSGNVTGAGAFNKIGGGTLAFGSAMNYSGATNHLAGTLLLSGSGAISSSSALATRSTIILDNTATNVADRINNSAPVTLLGNFLDLRGNAAADSSETIGTTTFSRGTAQVTIIPGAGRNATISTTGAAARDFGGTLFARGDNLGSGTGASLFFGAAPTLVGGGGAAGSTNISIIPWAYGGTSSTATATLPTNSLVTYGPNGVRPLNTTTEYVNNFAAAAPTDNVRLIGTDSVVAPTTINSLVVSGGGVIGTGTLTITSGAILTLSTAANIVAPLDFGTSEATLLLETSLTASRISGSGGLNKQGPGTLILPLGSSTYTGTTTVGGGTLAFGSNVPASGNGPLGSSNSAVVFAPAGFGTGGTTARMVYNGTGTGSFARDILVSGRVTSNNSAILPGIGTAGSNAVNYSGAITLDDSSMAVVSGASGTVVIDGNISGNGGLLDGATTILLNGNNSFSGGMELAASTVLVGSNTAFGSGMLKMTQLSGSPTIAAFGAPRTIANEPVNLGFSATYWTIGGSQDITFTGSINLSGSFTHNIANTALTTYAGTLHTGGFTKSGAGTLVLSGNNIYTGNTTVSSGVLRVTNSGALGTPQMPTGITPGATLELTSNALTSEPVNVGGDGVGALGAIRSTSGNNSLGTVLFASNTTIGVDAGRLNLTSAASAGGGLTKIGAGVLSSDRYRVDNFTVNVGTAAVNLGGVPADRVSRVAALTIAGGANPTAALDLGDNDMIAIVTSVADLTAKVAYARDGGAWDRPGLTSSAARASLYHLKTLGVMSGADYTSVGGTGLFDGLAYTSTNSLVKYTTLGDANFSGGIDPGDYTGIDTGFGGGMTGWVNGDFDGSGAVDFLDYVWIDLSFNVQNGTLQRALDYLNGDTTSPGLGTPSVSKVVDHFGQFGQPYREAFLGAVPEPVALGSWLAFALVTTARRRRRIR